MGKVTWTAENLEYIENNWGYRSIKIIAEKCNKTMSAVELKAKRLGLGSPYTSGEHISANKAAEELGIDAHTITDYWINKLGLKAKKRALKIREIWLIRIEDLMSWLKDNQDKWDSRKLGLFALGTEPDWLKEKRKYDETKPKRKFEKWSKHDENLVIGWTKAGIYQREIALRLGRTESSIQRKVSRLKMIGLLPKTKIIVPWTDIEDKMFIDMELKGMSDIEIAWELGRDVRHVVDHRRNLRNKGLYPYRKNQFLALNQFNDMLQLKEQGKSNSEIADRYGIHVTTVTRRFKRYASV